MFQFLLRALQAYAYTQRGNASAYYKTDWKWVFEFRNALNVEEEV